MRKTEGRLLLIMLMLFLFSSSAWATEISCEAEPAVVDTGQTVVVTVAISENPGFTGIQFLLSYDETVLRCDKCETDGILKGGFAAVNPKADGGAKIAVAGVKEISGDGNLAIFYFTAIAPGAADLTVTDLELTGMELPEVYGVMITVNGEPLAEPEAGPSEDAGYTEPAADPGGEENIAPDVNLPTVSGNENTPTSDTVDSGDAAWLDRIGQPAEAVQEEPTGFISEDVSSSGNTATPAENGTTSTTIGNAPTTDAPASGMDVSTGNAAELANVPSGNPAGPNEGTAAMEGVPQNINDQGAENGVYGTDADHIASGLTMDDTKAPDAQGDYGEPGTVNGTEADGTDRMNPDPETQDIKADSDELSENNGSVGLISFLAILAMLLCSAVLHREELKIMGIKLLESSRKEKE